MRASQDGRLSKALAVLDPPPNERESFRKLVKNMLERQEQEFRRERDELEVGLSSTQGKAALQRYVKDLRRLRASDRALNPSIRRFLAIEATAIENDIIEAGAMSVHTDLRVNGVIVRRPPPRNRPPNKSAQNAVWLARYLLERRGCELTTERKGKWHLLSQALAETGRDLRHHLAASLAENPKR
jgi:hypothetical protein